MCADSNKSALRAKKSSSELSFQTLERVVCPAASSQASAKKQDVLSLWPECILAQATEPCFCENVKWADWFCLDLAAWFAMMMMLVRTMRC